MKETARSRDTRKTKRKDPTSRIHRKKSQGRNSIVER